MAVSDEYKAQFFDEHMPNYDCKKPDCWHCEIMGLKPKIVIPVIKKQTINIPIARAYKRYSRNEEIYIRTNYPYKTAVELAELLGRNIMSIRSKIAWEGYSKKNN